MAAVSFSEIWCCVFLLVVRGISFRHVMMSLIHDVTVSWLLPKALRLGGLESGAVGAGWTFPSF